MDLVIDGKVIKPGTRVKTFRGEQVYFIRIAQNPGGASSGKIYCARRKRDIKDEFSWQVWYPSVVNGKIEDTQAQIVADGREIAAQCDERENPAILAADAQLIADLAIFGAATGRGRLVGLTIDGRKVF